MARSMIAGAVAAALVLACGDDEVDPTSSDALANASYLSEATAEGRVTLVDGSFDFPPGNPVERIDLVDYATGDFDGDDDTDAAVVLVETSGRAELFRLHALLRDGDRLEDVAARLVGDRIEVRGVWIEEGIIALDLTIRAAGENIEVEPTVPVTRHFALTGRGLLPIDPPSVSEAAPRVLEGGDVATLTSHEWLVDRVQMGDWSLRTDSLENRPSLRFVRELGDETAGTGRLYGTAGCNRIFGNYDRREDGSLRILGLAATRRACGDPEASVEQRIMSSLGAAQRLSIAEDALRIEFEGGTIHLRAGGELVPPEPFPAAPADGDGDPTESGRPT